MGYIRTTNKAINDTVLQHYYVNLNKLTELQKQIASGKRVDEPSDDPRASIDIMSSNTALSKLETYKSNINSATSKLEMVDSQLSNLSDKIQRAKELSVQAANGGYKDSDLVGIKEEINQIISSIRDIANTKFGSNYIFGGVNTLNAPYTTTDDGQVIYSGTLSTDDFQSNIEIGDNMVINTSVSGDEIFGYYVSDGATPPTYSGKGIFGTLGDLYAALSADPIDQAAISASLDRFDEDLNTVLKVQARIGGTLNRLEMTANKLENDEITFSEFKNNAEGVDLAKAVSDLAYQDTSFQASLKISATLMRNSLLNYL